LISSSTRCKFESCRELGWVTARWTIDELARSDSPLAQLFSSPDLVRSAA
jgi:hypothetical protein